VGLIVEQIHDLNLIGPRRVTQWAQLAREFGREEGVAPEHVDVVTHERRQPLGVLSRSHPAAPQALDDPVRGFVTEMVVEADKMIAKTKSIGWRVWSKPARQKHCDDLGTVINQADHMIYSQLHNVTATPADERREVDLKALLDKI
jgi:hypothetical protein